jgi:hypothetical protein
LAKIIKLYIMDIKDFEAELKIIDKDLSIRPNDAPKRVLEAFPDVNKLASILYCGTEVCTIPSGEIFDEKNGNYGIDLRSDGHFIAHRTRPEALSMVKQKLEQLKDKDYADLFFGRGEYSDAALRRPEPEKKGDITVVDTVEAEVKEVRGDMLEDAGGRQMTCKNCGKKFQESRIFLKDYIEYCSSYCYAVYNKKFSSLIYKKGKK